MTTEQLNELADRLESDQWSQLHDTAKEAARQLRLMAQEVKQHEIDNEGNQEWIDSLCQELCKMEDILGFKNDCYDKEGKWVPTIGPWVERVRDLLAKEGELGDMGERLATYNLKIQDWWCAWALVMENYSFITGGSREPVTITMKRPENDQRVFQLVVSLNNLRKQFADMESFMREHQIPMERPK